MLTSLACALDASSCFKQWPGLAPSKLGTRYLPFFSVVCDCWVRTNPKQPQVEVFEAKHGRMSKGGFWRPKVPNAWHGGWRSSSQTLKVPSVRTKQVEAAFLYCPTLLKMFWTWLTCLGVQSLQFYLTSAAGRMQLLPGLPPACHHGEEHWVPWLILMPGGRAGKRILLAPACWTLLAAFYQEEGVTHSPLTFFFPVAVCFGFQAVPVSGALEEIIYLIGFVQSLSLFLAGVHPPCHTASFLLGNMV